MSDAKDLKRTRYAAIGADIALTFASNFYQLQVNGYQPVLRDPPGGVSTGGGKQALQHLVLQYPQANVPVITVGSINMATQTGKLRTFKCVQQLYAQRFPSWPFTIQEADYKLFFDRALLFFGKQGVNIEQDDHPPEIAAVPQGRSQARGSSATWIIAALLLGLAVGAAALYVLTVGVPFG